MALADNTVKLQSLIEKANNLPNAGSGTSATNDEFLAMLDEIGMFPAITDNNAILTNESGDILLW